METDLLNPTFENQKRSHKLKRIVKAPNSYFMDVRCHNCKNVNTIFSHAQGKINCFSCAYLVGKSRGGRISLTAGTQFKVKQ